jgi:hypothetical protein
MAEDDSATIFGTGPMDGRALNLANREAVREHGMGSGVCLEEAWYVPYALLGFEGSVVGRDSFHKYCLLAHTNEGRRISLDILN